MFTPEQKAALAAKLDGSVVKTRTQSGQTLSYVEGWWAISEANRIFGFDGWQRETVKIRCVWEGERSTRKGPLPACSYIAKARVTVGSVVREGVGSGHGMGQTLGEAHESAIKEAETDAMKRALMTFGNPFGLALYDKAQTDVDRDDLGNRTMRGGARVEKGMDDAKTEAAKIWATQQIAAIATIGDRHTLSDWWKANQKWIDNLEQRYPADFDRLLRAYDDRMDTVVAVNGGHKRLTPANHSG